MLNKSLDNKLLLLKLCLYSIIVIICIIGGYKAFGTYRSIINLTADDISKWLNKTNSNNCLINLQKIKLNLDGFNIYFILNDISVKYETNTIVASQQITGRINILSTVLLGKIKVNNFIAKNTVLTANNIYPLESIDVITGKININNIDQIFNITAEFVVNNIDFKINTILNIQPNNIKIIKFGLENTGNNVRDVIKYLPEYLINQNLLSWLNTSLLSGSIKYSELLLNENNNFLLKIKFKDVKLQYAPNWPAVENLSATMEIDNDNLNIDMDTGFNQGFILGQPIKRLNAKLTGMNLDKAQPLLVTADIIAPIDKGIEFFKKTNLWNFDLLDQLSLQGKINLSIQLLIPTDTVIQTKELIKFSGNCELEQTGIIDNTKFVLDHDYLFIDTPFFKTKIFLQQDKKNIILEELFLFDNIFHKVKFINNSANKTLFFDSENAKGTFEYSNVNSGKYLLNFDILKLNFDKHQQSNNNNFDLLINFINQIEFHCEHFYLNEKYFGAIGANFITDLKKDLKIDQLYFRTKQINAEAVGNWNIQNPKTNINGKLSITDFGYVIKQFNNNSKFISNGHGFINFNLTWLKNPFGFNLDNIVGTLNLDIHSGVIIGVNPGLGRIIGLLNIENIQRRLQLDFSDITGGGLSFDTLNGDLNIHHGQMVFSNIIIRGPSANLTINGNTSLVSQQLDLSIEVTSKVGATLPLAAAVAVGNPIVGAALWLFNNASGAKITEFKVQKYRVIGTWSKPEINAI